MKQRIEQDDASVDSRESLVTEAVDEFIESVNRNEHPDVEEYARRYPRVADVLVKVLPALRVMRGSAEPLGTSAGRTKNVPEIDGCLGDYRILREIGRGGMGVVYEAEQISLRRRVALKVLPFAAALDPKRLERFKNEAQAAAKLHHSNIVPVYAVGCERGVYYYAMQVIVGESLADVIHQMRELTQPQPRGSSRWTGSRGDRDSAADRPTDVMSVAPSSAEKLLKRGRFDDPTEPSLQPLPDSLPEVFPAADTRAEPQAAISTVNSRNTPAFFQTVAELGIQAADALEHAHSQDVVHRDIKPANLLVDTRGNLWITDFGLARLLSDAGVTITGDVIGTIRYMSPEQALGRKGGVDHRSDIYSLGATLYELTTLQPAFDGSNREELLRQITLEEPTPARRLNRAIPTDLETIILKSMSKEPEDRYASAKELADDLRRFLDSRPIRARRPTVIERTAKWSRRHKSIVVSAMVMLALAVVGLTVSNVLIARERVKTQAAYDEVAQNFEQARKMLDFFMNATVEDLADKDDLQNVRSRLLEKSLEYYQEFIEQSGDNPPLQAELAANQLRVAKILHEIGSTPEARAALEKALETQRALVRDRPDDPELRQGLLRMYTQLGVFGGRCQESLVQKNYIQRELQLTDEQKARIQAIGEEKRKLDEMLCYSQDVSLTEMRRQHQQHTDAAHKAIAEVLNPDQKRRLDQISLQKKGIFAFSDPKVAAELALTAEQKLRIESIQKQACQKTHDCYKTKTPAAVGETFCMAERRINDLLTAEQKDRWRQMIGEPYSGRRDRSRGSKDEAAH